MQTSRRIDPFGNWYCEPHQDKLWRYLDAGGLRAAAVWHRRAGKDDLGLRWTRKALCRRVGNYWHMLPQAEQARKAIWEAINPHTGRRRIDEAFPVELRRRTRSNEMMIEFKNGSIWQVVGSDNYNALVGSPPIGIIFSEWSLADPACWAYLRPILRENGGWALFIYTPRGRNHGLSLYKSAQRAEGWFHETLSALDSGVFTPEELELEKQELIDEFGKELGLAYFEQEYLVSFDAANIGAIYASSVRELERRGRVCPVSHDPNLPVSTYWDFGFGDATSIWFAQVKPGPTIDIIDHYRSSGQDIKHYVSTLYGRYVELTAQNKLQLGRPMEDHEHRQAYQYDRHYVPHDGANHTLAAGGRSIGDQAYQMGVNMIVIPATDQVHQIAAARRTLPFCRFDLKRTEVGIAALESYHFPWDAKKKMLGDAPVHDWSSNDADAFEILAQVWQPSQVDKPPERPRFLSEATADEVFWPKQGGGSKWPSERI